MKICFIGHRKIQNNSELRNQLIVTISALIDKGANTFLFGSRSDFNYICWEVVTELQVKFNHIKRIGYTAPHETFFSSKLEREQAEQFMTKALKSKVYYTDFEEIIASKKGSKYAYILRNQQMIDDSDVCIFYYNNNYLPPKRIQSRYVPLEYQPKSGTAIAYSYAKQKKKHIINILELIKPSI